MPVHDWTRVEAGIFHDLQHSWIGEIARVLNRGLLPDDYYALIESQTVRVTPDVLAFPKTGERVADGSEAVSASDGGAGLLSSTPPKVRFTAEAEFEFYRRKQDSVAVRHVSGDRLAALVEVVSPGNKASRNALRSFVEKAAELLDKRVHLLILDLHPPGPRDQHGIHAAIWDEVAGQETAALDRPLTLAAYESGLAVRAYVEPVAVGDVLPDMPLFLEPGAHILVPLEATYQAAFAAVPRRWRRVLEAGVNPPGGP